jgi:FlaA1/EpsC-like NDP-sugar epimerase
MGASKRIAELVVLSLGNVSPTRMSAVRLGNVLGSQGSVVPLFLDQIAHRVALTVTDPEARRYFLTHEQAVAALLDALAAPCLPGSILVPQLAPPIRILDLARHLLRQHAISEEITFTGLRPGDKLEESLISSREQWLPGDHGGLRALSSPYPSAADLAVALGSLHEAVQQWDLAAALHIVQDLVPEYVPSSHLIHPVPHAEESRA